MDNLSKLNQITVEDEQWESPEIKVLRNSKVKHPIDRNLKEHRRDHLEEVFSVHFLHFLNTDILEVGLSEPLGKL
jgi:hypothetical protein